MRHPRRSSLVALTAALALLGGSGTATQGPTALTIVAGGGPMNAPASEANIAEATQMVRDSNGNVYLAGKRRVLKYDAATQTVSVFAGTGFVGYTGDGGPASQATFRGGLSIALDPQEQWLYIGDSASRVVRRVNLSTGTIQTIGAPGDFTALRSIGSIAVTSNGRVYITDPAHCVIYELNDALERFAGSGICQGSIDGQGGDAADDYVGNVLRRDASLHGSLGSIALDDSAGILYFVEQSRVRQVIGNNVETVAGTGVARWSVDGQGGDPSDDLGEYFDAASATIAPGAAVWIDRDHQLYIVDAAPIPFLRGAPDVRVRRFLVDDPILTTIAGPFPLLAVSAVSVSDGGDVFMLGTQSAGRQVFQAAFYSQTVTVVAGNGNSGCGDGKPATEACEPGPQSVIADAGGNATILEDSTAPVRRVDAGTGIISTISAPNSFTGGQAGDFVLAPNGFYFSDSASHQILLQNAQGGVTAVYGIALSQPGDPLGDDGPAHFATFQRPVGLAVDAQGNLFVADSFNRRVRRIDRQTQIITTIAGDGTSCAPPIDRTHVQPPNPRNGFPATAACLDIPARLAFDVGGDLLVTESLGHRIRRIAAGADGLITGAPDEIISTIAGTGAPGYSGDGTESTQAAVNNPSGIVVAPDGTIFFSDTGNRVVRRIDTGTRIITTIAGSASGGAADHITFGSDPTWTVLDTGGSDVGLAQNVCLGPFQGFSCPPGATGYGYGGGGWTANLNGIPGATWIWAPGITGATSGADSGAYFFRKDFFLAGTPTSGSISIAADNSATVLVNGITAGSVNTQTALSTFDIASYLVAGRNTITIAAQNLPIGCPTCTYQQNPAGVVFGGAIVTGGVSGGALDPLQTALESPRGLAIGRQSDQPYLYIADSDLDMVLRLPIQLSVLSAPVTISVADAQAVEGNTGSTPLVFEVTLDAPSTHTISVAYTTADGTATAGDDYTPTNGVLTFLPGEASKQVVVLVSADTDREPSEQLFLNLVGPSGATLARAQAVGTITNDDVVSISVGDAKAREGNPVIGSSASITFTVRLSAPSSQVITVRYATADDTATTADHDYEPASGVLEFLPGETGKTVEVTVYGDTAYEPDERFFLNLTNASGATIANAQAVGLIENDDPIMITVNETISVTDTLGVRPATMLTFADNVTVTDTPGVQPATMLTFADNVTVTDTPGVQPATMLTFADNVTVTDTPDIVPQGGSPTPVGTDVLIQGRNLFGQAQPVTVRFSTVARAGITFVDPAPAPPALPADFQLHTAVVDIHTTAQFTGVLTVCFNGSYPQQTRMLHFTGGAWVDVNAQQTSTQVCGATISLSPFAIGSVVRTPPPPPDRKRPVVTAPASITIVATESRGARGSDSPPLAAFLAGGSAVDDKDRAPIPLPPTALGSTATNATLFPLGTTKVTFSFRDAANNVGKDTATVTVVKPNDR
jgi:sugar lactone lactonase YvrE